MILLSPLDLAMAASLVVALAALSWRLHLGLEKRLVVAATRMVVQLLLVGLVLRVVFEDTRLLLVTAIAIVMLLVASHEVSARQHRRFSGWWGYGLGTASLALSSFSVAILTLTVVIGADPWHSPRYAIPLLGMLLGNTLNGLSLSLDRLTQGLWQQREVIEARLLLGQSWHEAVNDLQRECVRAGLTPIINSMAVSGLVSLPGMMTGQILAGTDPVEAVKYQILVMFLIGGTTGLGTVAAVWLGARRMFDHRQRLRLDRLRAPAG
jgi:putative ABC transport system permease protein